jgi:hypothetical protein
MIRSAPDGSAAELLRKGLIALVGLGIVGTVIELLFLRHWGSAGQAIVWPALAFLAAGLGTLTMRPSPRSIRAARAIALGVAAIALVGVGFHVSENLTAGPLDRNFAASWASMSPLEQWWQAVTGGVGPAPTMAPGMLLQLGLSLLLATVRHPAAISRLVGNVAGAEAIAVEAETIVADASPAFHVRAPLYVRSGAPTACRSRSRRT